jgi:uncharacterized OB-fold protein
MSFSISRDDHTGEFYEATANQTLLIRRCPLCGTLYPPQQRRCHDSDSLAWHPVSGEATLVSWAVDHAEPLDPVLAAGDGSTSVFGLVELSEGPWMQVAIVGTDGHDLAAGQPMVVEFVTPGQGEAIPAFTPAKGSS